MRLPSYLNRRDIVDLARLATPVALSRTSFMLMGLTDAVILARHAPGQLPHILNAFLPVGVAMGFGLGLMVGVQVLTAEMTGAGRDLETGRIIRRGLAVAILYGLASAAVCALGAGALLRSLGFDDAFATDTATCTRILAYGLPGHMLFNACASYLEALRRPMVVTVIGLGAVMANLVLDLCLVPEHGAAGVAWATTVSRYGMALAALLVVARTTPVLVWGGNPTAGEFARQNGVGLGAGLANVAEWGSFNLTHVIATLSSIDAGALWGLTVQMMGSVFMIYVGLGSATSVRVAERFGRGDRQGVTDASRLGIAAAIIVGAVMAITVWMAREWLAVAGLDAEGQADGARLAPMLARLLAAGAMVTLFDGLQGVASMALRAREVVWPPTAIHVACYAVVMVPLCWWLALGEGTGRGQGVWGVFAGVAVASVLAGILQAGLLEWYARRGGAGAGP
jgi:MATE family multidrug resistance protein